MTRQEVLYKVAAKRGAMKNLNTDRGLCQADIDIFCWLVSTHPRKRVRVYSHPGWLPNAYTWPASIYYIERNQKGRIVIARTSAQRTLGRWPHVTINGRRVD